MSMLPSTSWPQIKILLAAAASITALAIGLSVTTQSCGRKCLEYREAGGMICTTVGHSTICNPRRECVRYEDL